MERATNATKQKKRNQIIINEIYILGNEDTNRSHQHSINGVLEEHNAADDSRKALKYTAKGRKIA